MKDGHVAELAVGQQVRVCTVAVICGLECPKLPGHRDARHAGRQRMLPAVC